MGMLRPMGLDVTPTLKSIPFLKDVPRRAMRAAGKEARWFSLPAGQALFEAGDLADSISFVLSGSLGAFRATMDGRTEFVGHIRAGEPVGEMALFLGGIDIDGDGTPDDVPHSSSVYAIRDSEIMQISRKGWERMVKAEPELLEGMIRIMLNRLRHNRRRTTRSEPKVFTLVATSRTMDLHLRANALKTSLERIGRSACVIDEAKGDDQPATFFDELEKTHDIVILVSDIGDTPWYRQSIRQADRIWVVGRADARPSNPIMPDNHSPARTLKLVDVLLLHHGNNRQAAKPVEWLEAANASRVFHWKSRDEDDCDRLARIMAGRSIGVVLSGGGARAYAHIGAIRAIREAGHPIDFVGGSSMGAVIAACVAMGWDDDEIDRRIRKAFVDSNPLGDYTLPVVGMVRGHRVNARLKEHFGDVDIGDLAIPFFALSSNLTDGAIRLHRTGLLRTALRATISLPGILPPVVDEGEVLVDGAVLNNFPSNIMRDFHRGTVIGSDVTRSRDGFVGDEFANPPGFFSWIMQHGFSAAPPIAGLLMRAATVNIDPKVGHSFADVLVVPELEDVALRDWTAYDDAVEAGYKAAKAALDAHASQPRAAYMEPLLSSAHAETPKT